MTDSREKPTADEPESAESDRPHDGNWHVLCAGLPRPAGPISLAPGLALVPLKKSLNVFTLAAAGAAGFREWAMLEPLLPNCRCEIESAKDSDITPGYDTLNRAWLLSALLVLRGYTAHMCVACSSYSWSTIATHKAGLSDEARKVLRKPPDYMPTKKLPPFQGCILDFHIRYLVGASPRQDALTIDDIAWVKTHYNDFNRLAADSKTFRLALEAATDWRFSKRIESAIARLWGGIEAVFGISSELVYRVSLMAASLLEPRGESRKARFDCIKKLYGMRSKIVHGASLSEEKMQTALNDSFSLLRDLLLLAIERGHVLKDEDFDEAVFG